MNDRDEQIAEQYTSQNVTLEDIGLKYGLTRERVRQILEKRGVTREQSHRRLSMSVRIAMKERERVEQRCSYSYNCDFDTFREITGCRVLRSARSHPLLKRWWHYKGQSQRLGIKWEFTLPEFAALVGPRLMEIGLSKNKLVLTRKDQSGPFSKENCELVTLSNLSALVGGYLIAHRRRRERSIAAMKQAVELSRQGIPHKDIADRLGRSTACISIYLAKARVMGI